MKSSLSPSMLKRKTITKFGAKRPIKLEDLGGGVFSDIDHQVFQFLPSKSLVSELTSYSRAVLRNRSHPRLLAQKSAPRSAHETPLMNPSTKKFVLELRLNLCHLIIRISR